ncbi:MAG TPA: saccharopine dehydrogenase NADP-binding domain-containing protein [Burkholderiales bacterium]|nr:saccharopine dehydrogenase NADP-binding domain-containing protein [Burkholderiales bacterium]
MTSEIWILGGAGRVGRTVAVNLTAKKLNVVLVGRDRGRLEQVGAPLGPLARTVVVESTDAMIAQLKALPATVVVNTIGPFARTGEAIIRTGRPGSHYVDISNELFATRDALAMHDEAVAAGRTLVTGAGWGVLGTESVTLKLCEGRQAAQEVRVDMVPSIEGDGGPIGEVLAATILDGIAAGGWRYVNGELVRAAFGSEPEHLTLPDGTKVTTGSAPTAELEAAQRASGAPKVTAASAMVPTGTLARLAMPVMMGLARSQALRRLLTRRIAKATPAASNKPREHSWARARVRWADGTSRLGWLRAPDGMRFTGAVAAEVAARLARGEGRPGAYTPGSLFGYPLAEAAGGQLVIV